MKILHIISLLGTGGVERQVFYLADGLIARGHEVRILVLRGSGEKTVFRTQAPIDFLSMDKNLLGIWRAARKAEHFIQQFQPDAIHSHMFHACIFSRLLKLLVEIPYLVCTPHTSFSPMNTLDGGRLNALAYRLTDPFADLTTNVGKEATASFVRRGATPPKKIRTVYNGFASSGFGPDAEARRRIRNQLKISDETFLWLAAGRLSAPKDYPNLLCAFREVLSVVPGSALCIAGNGELEAQLKKLAAEFALEDAVTFLGARDDMPALMASADGYVLSSAWEGLPMVIGEAMVSELPVVATNCGSVAELVGEAGWLVPPRNAHELAATMIEVSSTPALKRAGVGQAAQRRICNLFSLDRICQEWESIYATKSIPPMMESVSDKLTAI